MSKKVMRLFQQFHPENYKVSFKLDHKKLVFSGSLVVTGKKVGRPSKRITLHQKSLKISNVRVRRIAKGQKSDVQISRINLQKSYDEVRIHTSESLNPGDYEVSLDFSGIVTDSMMGIYPSRFKHNDKDEVILGTQFESHHAREAFPCIDEPEAKATFDITITANKSNVTLSNMPEKSQKISGQDRTTIFSTSPVMSPYLVAFASGKMHSEESKTSDGIVVRSWCAISHPKSHLSYSVKEGVRVLEFFSKYFDTPYPLSKYDQVALPDFDAGAMENWGMATFREVLLLADPDNRSVSSEQFVSLVIAHEASHMWFGDLVTMKWWDELWLNESFASLMEHLSLDSIHPDWKQWEMYSSDDIASTTTRDIYSTIQPISVKVTDPDLIETLFDPGIVYAKGGRLLKSLREFIGDEAFRKGLKTYFEKYAYQNTIRGDLWKCLSQASGKDVDSLMTPWLLQPGMPVVHVKQAGSKLQLSQERFTLDDNQDSSVWPIPLLSANSLAVEVFDKSKLKLDLPNDEFVVLNQYGSGHYLVDYQEAQHRQAIARLIEKQELPAEGRMNLLNDLYVLSRQGTRSLVDLLETVAKNTSETRDGAWSLMLRAIATAQQLTEGDETSLENLKTFKLHLAKGQFAKLGWDDHANDDLNTKQLRHTMLALMIGGEDKTVIDEALKRYQSINSITELPAEIRSTILGAVVRFGDPSAVDKLLKIHPAVSSEVQSDITVSLSTTRDPKVALHILSTALGDNGFVRAQDVMRWFVSFFRNPYVRTPAWEFLVNNWDWFVKVLGHSKSFDFLPSYVASAITTPEWQKRYYDFFDGLDIKELKHNITIGKADINSRIAWRQRDEAAVTNFLKSQAKKP